MYLQSILLKILNVSTLLLDLFFPYCTKFINYLWYIYFLFQKILSFLLLVFVVCLSTARRHRPCRMPNNASLKAKWLEYRTTNTNVTHESHFMSPYIQYILRRHVDNKEHLERNECVPPGMVGALAGHMSSISDCPWHWVYNTDTNR